MNSPSPKTEQKKQSPADNGVHAPGSGAKASTGTGLRRFINPRSKILKALSLLLFIYAGYLFTLAVITPYLSLKYGPQWLSQQLGRTVALENMTLDPLHLSLQLDGFSIKEADGVKDFMAFSSATVDLALWDSIAHKAIVLTRLDVDNAHIKLVRLTSVKGQENKPEQTKSAEFNFSDILMHIKQLKSPETQVSEGTDIALIINQLALNAASVTLLDKPSGLLLNYPKIDIKLAEFDTGHLLTTQKAPKSAGQAVPKPNQYQINVKDDKHSELALSGQFQLQPLKINGDIRLDALPLAHYWQALDSLFEFKINNGRLSANGRYRLEQAKDDKGETKLNWVLSKGKLAINDVYLSPKGDAATALSTDVNPSSSNEQSPNEPDISKPSIRLANVQLSGINANSKTSQITIDSANSDNANIVLSNTHQGLDLVNLLQGNAEPKSEPQTITSAEASPETSAAEEFEAPPATDAAEPIATEEIAASQAKEPPTPSAPVSSPWVIRLNALNLSEYSVTLTEHTATLQPKTWRFSNIALTTAELDSSLGTPIDYRFAMTINDATQVNSQGLLDVLTQSLDSELKISKVILTHLQAYVEPFVNLTIEDGQFSTQGHLTISPERHIRYQGQAAVDKLSIKDNLLMQPLVNWDTMAIKDINYDSVLNHLSIEEIAFQQLFTRLIIAQDKQTNISQLIKSAAPTDNVQAKPSPEVKALSKAAVKHSLEHIEKDIAALKGQSQQAPLSFSIKRISVEDSSAFFADNSLMPNFGSGIEQLSGDIVGFSSGIESLASININGKIDKYAPVMLKGKFNPFRSSPYLDVILSFKKVELTSVNPYSGTYAGYYVDKGLLSLDLNYQLKDSQLQGKNHLVIEQLKLGKPSNSSLATSLPITLAIALLQDRHGVIDLGIAVEGDVNSPSFSFGSIVFAALGNVVTKIVTSPFTLLANLIGGTDDELDIIGFNYGQNALGKKQRSKLNKLAKALKERPQLTLELRGSIDVAHDRQALAEAKLHQQLAKLAGSDLAAIPANLSASQFPIQGPLVDALMTLVEDELKQSPEAILEQLKLDKPGLTPEELIIGWHIALYNLSRQHQIISNEELAELAQLRASEVKRYLVDKGQIDPSRLFLLNSKMTIKQQHSAQVVLKLEAS